ncbi:MFS transporter [Gulbenkiania mobilis]|uniref:MFS transporter n=1 Tax=Gulbenkiania mobilis TaxID=397457 RepID=UPI0006BBC434|nr:MFS transporter [Gulbenkiania mobilis]
MTASSPASSTPLLPFAGFYFWYFAFVGLFSPFWGLYLEALHFTPWQISVLIALSTVARILAPGLWGWLADRTGRRRPIVLLTSVLSAVAFAVLAPGQSFWWIFVTLAVAQFFWAAALPLVEASTAHLTRDTPGRYSRVRVWGSVGFVAFSVAGGYLLDLLSLAALPWMIVAVLAALAVAASRVPEVSVPRRQAAGSVWDTLRQPKVLALFACCFLMAFAHGPYYTFYSIGLKAVGYGKELTGWLWSVGVLSEIGIFLLMPRIMARCSLERLMVVSLVAAVLRFGLIAFCLSVPWLAVTAQALHAFTFGLHHAVSVGLIHRFFAEPHHARAQGLYIVASFGLGGTSGGLLGGVLWPEGGLVATFTLAAGAALIGVAVGWLGLVKSKH